MDNFFAGRWRSGSSRIEVKNPYHGGVVDTVPKTTEEELDLAISGLVEGARAMRQQSPRQRGEILDRAAVLLAGRAEEFALGITDEAGKTMTESRGEVQRAIETLRLSAEEARRLTGEMIPLEGAPGGAGKFGFTLRVPCGIVAAISPFNFPLNLVVHKVGPAIAGGNAVLLKPASATPLTALRLVSVLLDAGLPETAIACVTGSGATLGQGICRDSRIRKISFTGSLTVGEEICRQAGLKKVTMELGGNGPVIVMDDADLQAVAKAVAVSGYANAGQVCISTQRVLVSRRREQEFLHELKSAVQQLKTGDPRSEQTDMGPMIQAEEAERVEEWIAAAVEQGARLECGGTRIGTLFAPTIISGVTDDMQIARDELFGPAVGVSVFADLDAAIALVNRTPAGLSCGLFTNDLERAFRFAREAHSGNIHINGVNQYRADLMPYGGLKESGLGKEGPRYAIREMTEEKMVVLHLSGG